MLSQNTLCASVTALTSRARTGYERVKIGEHYYTSAHDSCYSPREEERDSNSGYSDDLFERGDYVNDARLYNDRERARVLHNRMEQWQALNDEPVDWGNKHASKYRIRFDCTYMDLFIDGTIIRDLGVVYFSNAKKAEEAIEVFRDDLMRYYTEYRSRLDEPKRKTK